MDNFYKTDEWKQLKRKVLTRDNRTCRYCGQQAFTADHVKPRSKGGADELFNLVASCVSCNQWFNDMDFLCVEDKVEYYRSKYHQSVRSKVKEYRQQFKDCVDKESRDRLKRKTLKSGGRTRQTSRPYYCLECGRTSNRGKKWITKTLCDKCG